MAAAYEQTNNAFPSWTVTKYHDAALLAAHAIDMADVRLQRDTASFVVKNLLPLLLLTTLLYASLFLPFSRGTPIRVNLAVTSILTSAVLLGNISNRLPDIGYTVAIEYGFYVFFALALTCTVIAILGNHRATSSQERKSRHLSTASKVIYPLLVLGVVLAYVTRLGEKGPLWAAYFQGVPDPIYSLANGCLPE